MKTLIIFALLCMGCGVAADKPDMRRFPDKSLLKFYNISPEDGAGFGRKIKDFKLPLVVISSDWHDEWNEYWYNVIDQVDSPLYIPDRNVQKY